MLEALGWIVGGSFVLVLLVDTLQQDIYGPHYMSKKVSDEEWQAVLNDVRYRTKARNAPTKKRKST